MDGWWKAILTALSVLLVMEAARRCGRGAPRVLAVLGCAALLSSLRPPVPVRARPGAI